MLPIDARIRRYRSLLSTNKDSHTIVSVKMRGYSLPLLWVAIMVLCQKETPDEDTLLEV